MHAAKKANYTQVFEQHHQHSTAVQKDRYITCTFAGPSRLDIEVQTQQLQKEYSNIHCLIPFHTDTHSIDNTSSVLLTGGSMNVPTVCRAAEMRSEAADVHTSLAVQLTFNV